MKGTDMTTEREWAGTNVFVVDSLSRVISMFNLELHKKKVASLHVNFVNKKYRGSFLKMSRTVILKLTVGDHVKVVSGGNDVFITSDNYSGFTGTFLF